jgi:hypothetical protein
MELLDCCAGPIIPDQARHLLFESKAAATMLRLPMHGSVPERDKSETSKNLLARSSGS